MKYNINCIYNYYDTLLSEWGEWNKNILVGLFDNNASNLSEALQITTSDGRSRAKEIYRLGLLTHELTKGMQALNSAKNGENLQTRLGFLVAIIYQAYSTQKSDTLLKAISGINAIFSIVQPIDINGLCVSVNSIICRLLEVFEIPNSYDRLVWIRYLVSGFCCTLKKATNSVPILDFILGKSDDILLQIIDNKSNEVRASFKNSNELLNVIGRNISLTNIYHQKMPLFLLGSPKDDIPRGFYGLAEKFFGSFLKESYELEKNDYFNSPFRDLYIDDEGSISKKHLVLETIKDICKDNISYNNSYKDIMKSLEEGAIEALTFLTGKTYVNNRQTSLFHPASPASPSPFINSLLTAIRTKPFILLAGISGTGKSRIVRKLAQATTTKELQEYQGDDFDDIRWQIHTPENFEIIQVKPNWHNSMDVLGYLSNIPTPHYVLTPLVNFIIKAWKHKDIPFFLCLDEMNLAPVEEYFAEFLSAIESRSIDENGDYWTDALVKPFRDFGQEVYNDIMPLITRINPDATRFADHGLTLPPNLIVIGTVNMDETTFSFSRKVLDRAMSIEMNEVDYDSYISGNTDDGIKAISGIENLSQLLIDRHIEAKEFVSEMSDAQNVIDYLKKINILLEGTPFKLGYRAANEALIYVKSAQEFGCDDYRKALDEFTLMKILSRMEGDEQKLAITDSEFDNEKLSKAGVDPEKAKEHDGLSILSCLWEIIENNLGADTKSVDKIKSMISQLRRDHFVSYWN